MKETDVMDVHCVVDEGISACRSGNDVGMFDSHAYSPNSSSSGLLCESEDLTTMTL